MFCNIVSINFLHKVSGRKILPVVCFQDKTGYRIEVINFNLHIALLDPVQWNAFLIYLLTDEHMEFYEMIYHSTHVRYRCKYNALYKQ